MAGPGSAASTFHLPEGEARGPGRIALTRDAAGEVVVIPLHSGPEVDVRGHAFPAASENVSYDFIKITGLVNILHGGEGMYMDRFAYFSRHVLLRTDPATQLAARRMPKDWVRKRAGIPLVMMEAAGPGRVAASEGDPGEIVARPLAPGQSVDVVEHHFLAATAPVSYEQFRGASGGPSGRAASGSGFTRSGTTWTGSPPSKGDCCSGTARATRSSATWPKTSGSTSSRAPWSTRTGPCA